ncbi:MAG: DUF389 domain-containing protein [Rhodothermales bacterium]|nr:DUF389 domain-containing protein [Rhodothermales bacterium]
MPDLSSENRRLGVAARALGSVVRDTFSLDPDTDYEGALQQIRSDVEIRGGNTWALVCAIVIASVGLNVNATAVIIGAMLISPLMGPIIGAGFGVATNDMRLMRRSVRNLLVAMAVGMIASTLYFAVSPLEGPQSELLARTRPTLYDVLIAFFGGVAGVVAVSRKANRGNVIPGVAIATALMPPLCTAGYGIATGDVWFFLGAIHLFLINALFISLAAIGMARLMRFPIVERVDPTHQTRARVILGTMSLLIVVPSGYTAWEVVQEARFQLGARRFITENLNFDNRALLNIDVAYTRTASTIGATVLGPPLTEEMVTSMEQRLPSYGLENTRLVLRQPDIGEMAPEQVADMVRRGILEDLYQRNTEALQAREDQIRVLEDEVVRLRSSRFPVEEVTREVAALFPELRSVGIGNVTLVADSTRAASVVVVATWRALPPEPEQDRLRQFFATRLGVDSLHVVHARE